MFIGGKHLRYTHNILKTMTTFFINEAIDQELDLDGLSSVTGGMGPGPAILLALGIAGGVADGGVLAATLLGDVLKGDELGTGFGEVIDDLVESGGGSGDGDVPVVNVGS